MQIGSLSYPSFHDKTKDWGPPWVMGPQGLEAPMGWGPHAWVSGLVYETKPIIVSFVLFGFVSFKECSLKATSALIGVINFKVTSQECGWS